MTLEEKQPLTHEQLRAWPALASYVEALSRLSSGKVICEQGDADPDTLRAATETSVSLPHGQETWTIRVENAAEGNGPPHWREPTVARMLAAMQENLSGPKALKQWPSAVRATWQLVTEHPTRAMTLAEVSNCVNLSAGYLGEQFERLTGSSFKRILRDERIAYSCDLLENSNLRVAEIASRLGGLSLSQFNRSFVAATGHSPTDWRRHFARRRSPGAGASYSAHPQPGGNAEFRN